MFKQKISASLSWLQKLGQSLMIPVSVLPAAGLVVALGRALQSGFPPGHFLHQLGQICYAGGLAVFEQLPLIFCVGVAIGFAGGAGVAGLSAVAGYFTLTNLLKVIGEIRGLELPINTGVFGGILVGALAAWMYNRYSRTQLHAVLGFFSGKRLVPMVTILATLFLSLAMGYVWPPIQNEINHFGQWVMQSDYAGAFYAAGKRLLIPVGLHHVYYPPFLYQFGEFVGSNGQVVHGDSARYFAGDTSAGIFMASEFPIMLFGLPAAALAMVLRARREKRKAIAGVMLTAALTSIITGITEPIEFAFIFVAPILYVLHVVLAFVSGLLTQGFDIHLGYTFSASFIDFILGFFNSKNSMQFWLIVGPVMAALYFGGFYTLIGVLNLKTPGRDLDEDTALATVNNNVATGPASNLAWETLVALGGAENITSLEACITRLRTVVKDPARVDQNRLRALGAAGIFHDGARNFQVVYGVKSDMIKEQIKDIMDGRVAAPVSPVTASASATVSAPSTVGVGATAAFTLNSPLRGRIVPLTQVPDATFSQKILGDGIAFEPSEGVVYAPFDGVATQVFKTGHAVGLTGPDGIEVLIHVGIDTVKLNGEGFHALVKSGDKVKKGEALIEFDIENVRKKVPSLMTPMVITNSDEFKTPNFLKADGLVLPGEKVLTVEPKGFNA